MKFIVGTKSHMSQVFGEDGRVQPVTILHAPAMFVTQLKNSKKDGYTALQVGFSSTTEKHVASAQKGHIKKAGLSALVRHFKEFRMDEAEVGTYAPGASIDLSVFKAGDTVDVSAISKGKGYQGVVKRHHFKGGQRTHGQKHSEREAGSIGGGGRAGGRVAKGMRMAGRMGGERNTIRNLSVVAIDLGSETIAISGAVPGRPGTVVEIRTVQS